MGPSPASGACWHAPEPDLADLPPSGQGPDGFQAAAAEGVELVVHHVGEVRISGHQHQAVSDRLDAVDVLVDEWATHANVAAAARLAAELDEVDRLLVEHLADEERDAFPVLDAVLSDEEWDDIHRHARRHKPPLPIFVLLGLMLESVPEAERDAWFEKEMPAPIRMAYRSVGRRQYERAVRRLRGDEGVAPGAVPATA